MVVVVVLETVSTTTLADSVPLLAGAFGVPFNKDEMKTTEDKCFQFWNGKQMNDNCIPIVMRMVQI